MSFSRIWTGAWRAYRANAGVSARIMGLYYLIPLAVAMVLLLAVVNWSEFLPALNEFSATLAENVSNDASPDVLEARAALLRTTGAHFLASLVPLLGIGGIVALAFFFISFFAYAALIGGASRATTERMPYPNAVKAGKALYWPLMGYTALLMLLVFSLEMAGILVIAFGVMLGSALGSTIGGVVFLAGGMAAVGIACLTILGRLVLGPYALACTRAGVLDSFRASWALTQGKTWRMAGFLVLISFFFACSMLTVLVVLSLPSLAFVSNDYASATITMRALLFETFSQFVVHLVLALFITPFTVFFFRQVYRTLSKRHV